MVVYISIREILYRYNTIQLDSLFLGLHTIYLIHSRSNQKTFSWSVYPSIGVHITGKCIICWGQRLYAFSSGWSPTSMRHSRAKKDQVFHFCILHWELVGRPGNKATSLQLHTLQPFMNFVIKVATTELTLSLCVTSELALFVLQTCRLPCCWLPLSRSASLSWSLVRVSLSLSPALVSSDWPYASAPPCLGAQRHSLNT